MSDGRPELVHVRTRRAVREMMSDTVLRDIDGMWQDEGFAPGTEDPDVGGQRVSRFQSYLDQVDWADRGHVDRALRVFETALGAFDDQYLGGVRRCLERDGYTFADRRITGGPVRLTVREGALSAVEDPAAIRDHLDRISRALADDDPAQAIGSAKELVESTAKLVLRTRDVEVSDRDDFPELVRAAQVALDVHPKQATPGPDGSDAVKRILGGATAAALGVNELRNRGFGTGHGPASRRTGLGPRHAHLAVSSAKLWCEFMLDTLADPDAPWRKHGEGAASRALPTGTAGRASRCPTRSHKQTGCGCLGTSTRVTTSAGVAISRLRECSFTLVTTVPASISCCRRWAATGSTSSYSSRSSPVSGAPSAPKPGTTGADIAWIWRISPRRSPT